MLRILVMGKVFVLGGFVKKGVLNLPSLSITITLQSKNPHFQNLPKLIEIVTSTGETLTMLWGMILCQVRTVSCAAGRFEGADSPIKIVSRFYWKLV